MPYEEVLGAAGLKVDLTIAKIPDLGGADLRSTFVVMVPPGSEAEKAGIKTADRVTSINGVEVTRTSVREEMAKLVVGDEVKVKLLRGTESMELTVKAGTHERTTCKLRRAEAPTDLQKKVLEGWLTRPADY